MRFCFMRKLIFLFLIFLFLIFGECFAQKKVEIYLFYGEGCPHCAKAKKFLESLKEKYPIELKEYEVYFHPQNMELFKEFCQRYGFSPEGVPTIFIGEKYFIGFGERTKNEIERAIQEYQITPSPSPLPDTLSHESKITWSKIISLAFVDSINPCALAVLTLMLIAILTYNPEDKNKVLLAGLAFVGAVFLMYLFYGLVIIKFFQLVQKLASVRLWLYKILGGFAIILGILNIKDFIKYKPGGFLTEMPLFLRPKVKKIISGVTSPRGAFFVGAFVTIFLLPCTMGPYLIAGGILSFLEIMKTLPYLFLYNLIFILPMLVIVFLIYWGTAKIEDVSRWKERNIRYLHLTAGLVILLLGLGIVLGWF